MWPDLILRRRYQQSSTSAASTELPSSDAGRASVFSPLCVRSCYRARKKQKYTEMEKLVDSLQRQLSHFEATKMEVEGLLIENAMLRRLSTQQTHCIESLKHQLADAQYKENTRPSPVIKGRSYDLHVYQGYLLEEKAYLPDDFSFARIPLPVPQFEPYSAMTQRGGNESWNHAEEFVSEEYRVGWMDRGGSGSGLLDEMEDEIFEKECFSDLLSDTCHVDGQLSFQDMPF